MNGRCATSVTACFCHSLPPFRALTFALSAYPANGNLVCFVPVGLDSQTGLFLPLHSLPLSVIPAPQRIWTVLPNHRSRIVFFWPATQPCRTCGNAPASLRFRALPKYL